MNAFVNKKLFQRSIAMIMALGLLLIAVQIDRTNSMYAYGTVGDSSTKSVDARGVVLINTQTVPSFLTLTPFKGFAINSTVLNGSPNKIQIALVGCNGPLSASFDKHVEIVKTGSCNIMRSKTFDLAPGQSMAVSTKDNLIDTYIPRLCGDTKSTLQLSYTQNGTLLSHTQPFVFKINGLQTGTVPPRCS
jgi:hypothetical protein